MRRRHDGLLLDHADRQEARAGAVPEHLRSSHILGPHGVRDVGEAAAVAALLALQAPAVVGVEAGEDGLLVAAEVFDVRVGVAEGAVVAGVAAVPEELLAVDDGAAEGVEVREGVGDAGGRAVGDEVVVEGLPDGEDAVDVAGFGC